MRSFKYNAWSNLAFEEFDKRSKTKSHKWLEDQVYNVGQRGKLVLQRGDITKWSGDAIVNAANELLIGGGGVDGAIHRAAGPRLLKACRSIPPVKGRIRCPTGEARITGAFKLPVEHVIHTVGPVYASEEESAPLLKSAYRSALKLANDHNMDTVAFPAISCGIYGYPSEAAAKIALDAVRDDIKNLWEVHFLFFDAPIMNVFVDVAEKMFKSDQGDATDTSMESNIEETSQKVDPSEEEISKGVHDVMSELTNQVDNAAKEEACQEKVDEMDQCIEMKVEKMECSEQEHVDMVDSQQEAEHADELVSSHIGNADVACEKRQSELHRDDTSTEKDRISQDVSAAQSPSEGSGHYYSEPFEADVY